MDAVFALLNNSKVFAGLAMLMVNIGSRYIITDFGLSYDQIMNNDVVKQIIVFCMIFAATRDAKLSIIISFLFWFVIMGILDKRKPLNILTNDEKARLSYNQGAAILSTSSK